MSRFGSGPYSFNKLSCMSQEGHPGLLRLSRLTHSANSEALVISLAALCGPFNSLPGRAGRDRLPWAVLDSTALCLLLSASPVTTLSFWRVPLMDYLLPCLNTPSSTGRKSSHRRLSILVDNNPLLHTFDVHTMQESPGI